VTKRRRILASISIATVWAVLLTGCGGENKPGESELRGALVAALPEHLKVTDFNVEAMQNEGNEVEPRFIARFNASAEVTDALYERDGRGRDPVFLKKTGETGDVTELFGKSMSVLYQGKWEHDVRIDGNTLRELGQPRSAFAGANTIVRGSDEEKAHFDAMEQQDAEFTATTQALPLDTMIADFYASKGEFAGKYVIHEVIAHRIEKKSNAQALVHAKYSYKKPGADKGAGEDRRAFTLARGEGGSWEIAKMGFAGSGRVE